MIHNLVCAKDRPKEAVGSIYIYCITLYLLEADQEGL